MRSPRSRCVRTLPLAGLGVLCLMGCTNGVGRPFVQIDSFVGDASSDAAMPEGDRDATPAVMDAGAPPKPKDAGPNMPKPLCQQLEDNWSYSADREAEKLVEALNFLRANRGMVCQRSNPTPPLMNRAELACAARQRLHGVPIARPEGSPSLDLIDGEYPRAFGDFYDRVLKAELVQGTPFAELVIENANSMESVVNELLERPDVVCDYLTPPFVNLFGVAKVEHVWVIDLGNSGPFGGRGGHP